MQRKKRIPSTSYRNKKAIEWIRTALALEKEGESRETVTALLSKAADSGNTHAIFLLGERAETTEEKIRHWESIRKAHPEACYRLALEIRPQDETRYRRLRNFSASMGYLPALSRTVEETKNSPLRKERCLADRLIRYGYGIGLCGYEIETARMLYEGVGVYGKEALGATNPKRGVEILLQLEDSAEKAFLLGSYLLKADEVPTLLCGESNVSGNLLPPPEERLPAYREQGIQWLVKADTAEAFAFLGDYYWEEGERDAALAWHRKAAEKDPEYDELLRKKFPQTEETPEEKLSFLFSDEDPHAMLRILKRTL